MDHNKFFDGRTTFVAISLGIVFFYILISSFFCPGWIAASILAYGMYVVLWAYSLIKKDRVLMLVLTFATAAGFTELLADNWLVNGIQDLEYANNEPMLVASPMYMPFAWAVVLTQIGTVGWRLIEFTSLGWASLISGLVGGLIIPFYEHCAKGACWWVYTDWGHEFWNAPYYIILGEALICAVLPFAIRTLTKGHFILTIVLGLLTGLWIYVSYFFSYLLVG